MIAEMPSNETARRVPWQASDDERTAHIYSSPSASTPEIQEGVVATLSAEDTPPGSLLTGFPRNLLSP